MCARDGRASLEAVGTHSTGGRTRVGGASVAERVREILREGELRGTPWRLQTVSDKMRCGSNDALSASRVPQLPGPGDSVVSLSASDRSPLSSTKLAMSVCLQSRPFKQLPLIHTVAISPTVITPCDVVLPSDIRRLSYMNCESAGTNVLSIRI